MIKSYMKLFLMLLPMLLHFFLQSELWTNGEGKQSPFPLQFSIPEEKIVKNIPEKDVDFAPLIPGQMHTYIYNTEAEYYQDYQRSYYAITHRKAGWDCMRHYEILANGCIPYFLDLEQCDLNTMYFLPRDLIYEAMHLPGVSYLKIDHEKFDKKRYFEILHQLLEHTRKYLTTEAMASYLLKTINYMGNGNILFLSNELYPDYMRCLTLIGLKQIYRERVIDVPKVEHVYKTYLGSILSLYGKGISYTRIIEDFPTDRENIEERIRNREFDMIIYGSVHRGLRYHDLVKQYYPADKIIYICGEDAHGCPYVHQPILFLREFNSIPY